MSLIQAALYARVSSDQQAQAQTIRSQLKAMRTRIADDGAQLGPGSEFVDDGYSGSTLIRPDLERLRDAVANGSIDRVYVHSPDRLARKYAYQVLLVDEWQRAGMEIVFLNHELGGSPEDELLLQVQGMMPSMSVPRSWSAAAVVSGIRPRLDRSVSCPVPRMDTAISRLAKAVGKPVMRSAKKRRKWFARSLPGWVGNA